MPIEYHVVDQNYLREPNPMLHSYLSAGNYAVFPDVAAMEGYKGDALTNLRRSLEIVRNYPARVLVLKNTQTVIRITQRGSRRLGRLLVDLKQTAGFADFCRITYAIDPTKPSPALAEIEQKARAARAFFQDKLRSTQLILTSIRKFAGAFPPDQLKLLRKDEAYTTELFSRMLKHVLLTTADLMQRHGFFLREPSRVRNNYLFRFTVAGYLLSIRWVAMGGQSHLPIEKLQNDMDDMAYVAYATYYDGLLSKDKKMNEMYSRTKAFLARC